MSRPRRVFASDDPVTSSQIRGPHPIDAIALSDTRGLPAIDTSRPSIDLNAIAVDRYALCRRCRYDRRTGFAETKCGDGKCQQKNLFHGGLTTILGEDACQRAAGVSSLRVHMVRCFHCQHNLICCEVFWQPKRARVRGAALDLVKMFFIGACLVCPRRFVAVVVTRDPSGAAEKLERATRSRLQR